MSGDQFSKVSRGNRFRFPAAVYNALLGLLPPHAKPRTGSSVNVQRLIQQQGWVRIRNDSGGAVAQFSILGISDTVLSVSTNPEGFKSQHPLAGDTPDIDLHDGRFAVLLDPIPSSDFGRAVVSGIVPVQLTVKDEYDDRADIIDGSTATLQTNTWGAATILWKEPAGSDPGEPRWAIVKIGNQATKQFPALITGHDTIVANSRYRYSWSEAEWDGDTVAVKTGGRTGTTSAGYALNDEEATHGTPPGPLAGVDSAGDDYPAGFKMRPIGAAGDSDDHVQNRLVMMRQQRDINGNTIFRFASMPMHDGTCTA